MNVILFFLNSSLDFGNHNFFFPLIFGNDITTIAKKKFHLFRQCHCHNSIPIFFFPSHFRQWHCHNYHFFPYFGNGIVAIGFFFFGSTHTSSIQDTLGQGIWAARISVTPLPKFKIFSLPLFLFLSHTFVEFRQHRCRNSLSFLISLNKLEQYL